MSATVSRLAVVAMGLFLLNACSSVSVEQYANNKPQFVAENFFDGKLHAHGIVKDRGGQVIRYFSAEIDASWQDLSLIHI